MKFMPEAKPVYPMIEVHVHAELDPPVLGGGVEQHRARLGHAEGRDGDAGVRPARGREGCDRHFGEAGGRQGVQERRPIRQDGGHCDRPAALLAKELRRARWRVGGGDPPHRRSNPDGLSLEGRGHAFHAVEPPSASARVIRSALGRVQ
jgi:hypothetical protein